MTMLILQLRKLKLKGASCPRAHKTLIRDLNLGCSYSTVSILNYQAMLLKLKLAVCSGRVQQHEAPDHGTAVQ